MPFTAAHPAIVLPFSRSRHLSATGLIAGSVAPDFEYFFKLSVESYYSHTLLGVLYYNVPVALLLAFVFHRVAKTNLVHNLPHFFQRRLRPMQELDFIAFIKKRWFTFLVSALLGALSHLLWDSFTHNSGYFARLFSDHYSRIFIPYDGVKYPLFYALQQISTVVGLAVVLLYVVFIKPQPGPVAPVRFLYWIIFLLITGATVALRFTIHPSDYEIGNLVVTTVSGMLLAVVVNGFINFNNHGQTITMGTGRQTGS